MHGDFVEECRRTYANPDTGLEVCVVFFRELLTMTTDQASFTMSGRIRMETALGQPVAPRFCGATSDYPDDVVVLTGLCEFPLRRKHLPTPPADG